MERKNKFNLSDYLKLKTYYLNKKYLFTPVEMTTHLNLQGLTDEEKVKAMEIVNFHTQNGKIKFENLDAVTRSRLSRTSLALRLRDPKKFWEQEANAEHKNNFENGTA